MTTSKIFFLCCVFFAAGVAYASFVFVSYGAIFVVYAVLGAFFIFFSKHSEKEKAAFLLCALFFLLGVVRYGTYEDAIKKENDISVWNGKEAEVVGIVEREIEHTQRSQQIRLTVRTVATEGGVPEKASGTVLVVVWSYPVLLFGDEISASAVIVEPQNTEEFAQKDYLAKDGIFSHMLFPEISVLSHDNAPWMQTQFHALRAAIKEKLEAFFPEPHSSFLAGLLIGVRETLPREFKDDLSRSGTSHIVALSGYNIMIIGTAVNNFLAFLGVSFSVGFWLAALFIVLFTLFCGAQASLVRAAIMGILVLVAKKQGRQYSVKNALVFAGALMIFLNPKILRFDMSFQLSFAATLGLIFLAPRLKPKLRFVPDALRFRETLAETLSAQTAVLPLLVAGFGSFSIVSPLSNILVLSAIPMTMLFGFMFLLVSFVWMPFASVFGYVAWMLMSYEIFVIQNTAKLPFAAVNDYSWIWAIAIYGTLAVYALRRKFIFAYEKYFA